jgi:LytS/YehU family sensor histidine kinase
VLDELIMYLRAAMPHMRDTSSTLGQEIALARAYLEIMRLRLGDRLRVEVRCADELQAARLPPMLLLPLLDRALVRIGGAGTGTICIAAGRVDMRLAIGVRFTGDLALHEDVDGLNATRQRLAALYGERATLTLARQEAGSTEVRLGLPFEYAIATVTSN